MFNNIYVLGPGASGVPCADTYYGTAILSEPENKALHDAVFKTMSESKVAAFFSMHSYSQLLLLPHAHTHALPGDYDELVSL